MLETARMYRREAKSPKDLVQTLLAKIEKDTLNAYITVDEAGSIEAACQATQAIKQGNDEIMLGIPIAVKDNICTRGIPTSCGSKILSNFVPMYDAHVIERLKSLGAVIIGKTNLDEFAMGSTTTTSYVGPTLNPWDHSRTPGGSSGGSAAAVAAGLCAGALGSDTGGSIRQPASFCGITGLKPTYGSVSRYGLIAFASSLDQIGPLARSARDVSVLFDAIKGYDPKDSTSVAHRYNPSVLNGMDIKGLRIGVPRSFLSEGLSAQVEQALRSGISILDNLGATIVDMDIPHIKYGVASYYIVANAEASSNLARYDGVRYGMRDMDAQSLFDMYLETRAKGFGNEVKRRIMLGTYALSAGYYDQYYHKASKVRSLLINDFKHAFSTCDLIVGPTTPVTAFGLYEMVDDPLSIYLLDIYTIPANLTGLPAISIPCGFDDNSLPVGMQLIAPAFREDLLLGTSITFQDNTNFHKVKP